MRTRSLSLALLAATFFLEPATGQPYSQDILLAGNAVYALTPTGGIGTAVTGLPPGGVSAVCMDLDNRHVLVSVLPIVGMPALLRGDPQSRRVVGTLWAGPPLSRVVDLGPTTTGDFVVVGGGGAHIVKGDGSGVSTLHVGPPFTFSLSVIQDVATANFVVGDLFAVYQVAPGGAIQMTWSIPSSAYVMTQDHRTGRIFVGDGVGGRIFEIDPARNRVTTFAAWPEYFASMCFDRAAGHGELVLGGGTMYRITTALQVVAAHPVPWPNEGSCFDRGRNLVCRKIRSPNVYRIDLDIPGQANRPYVIGLSITGFTPGIPVDARTIQLNPDAVTVLAVTGQLGSMFPNNVGVLNSSARAAAHLDLRRLSNVAGTRVWIAALTIDPGAPSHIGIITKQTVITLE